MMKPNGKYASAEDRWAGLGSYYSMFPAAFANRVVARYSKVGDTVLDPFAGRGTALFSSVRAGRKALGIEVNPVGWIYSKTKLNPAPREEVLARITDIESHAAAYRRRAHALPEFFHQCFSSDVRSFLLSARSLLNWRDNDADLTAMAFLLTHLHPMRKQLLFHHELLAYLVLLLLIAIRAAWDLRMHAADRGGHCVRLYVSFEYA